MIVSEALYDTELAENIERGITKMSFDFNNISPLAAGNLPGGVGIRAIASQSGQYITGSFANCPPLNYNNTYGFYHYFGFSATNVTADMGVLYSGEKNGWLPYLLLSQNGKNI